MAIDTRDKRASLLGFGEEIGLMPVADGTIDRSDRFHLLGLYRQFGDEEEQEPVRRTVLVWRGRR